MNTKRQKLSLIILILILLLNSTKVYAFSPEDGLTASSAILMDTVRGQVLYEKNANSLFSPSIMCKLMTALITIENTDLVSKVTISKNAASINGASLNLIIGNKYTVEDLLYAVMLSAGNDAAIALAEHVGGGDVNKFVEMMNAKAKELNLTDTFFVNPTGLYDEQQYTSTTDIAKLVKTAISNRTFNIIFGARGIGWVNGKDSFVLTNQNKLFWSNEGVDGGKLGTIPQNTAAVTTATRNGRRLISVVINDNEEKTLSETRMLFDYGFEHFDTGILFPKNTTLRSIKIEDVNVDLISKMDVYYTYPLGESYIKSISFTPNDKLVLPVSTDTIAGVLHCKLKDDTEIEVNLYPNKEIVAPEDYKTKIRAIFTENKDLVTLVIILIIVECILILYNLTKLITKLFKKITRKNKNTT